MTFSILWMLLLYLVLILFVLLVVAIQAFHILRYGGFDRRNHVVLIVCIVGILAVLVGSAVYLSTVDWSQTITVTLPSLSLP